GRSRGAGHSRGSTSRWRPNRWSTRRAARRRGWGRRCAREARRTRAPRTHCSRSRAVLAAADRGERVGHAEHRRVAVATGAQLLPAAAAVFVALVDARRRRQLLAPGVADGYGCAFERRRGPRGAGKERSEEQPPAAA